LPVRAAGKEACLWTRKKGNTEKMEVRMKIVLIGLGVLGLLVAVRGGDRVAAAQAACGNAQRRHLVELSGIEPLASSLRTRRSPS
jgi:hypothetical protein